MRFRLAIVALVVLAGVAVGGLAGAFFMRGAPASTATPTAEYLIGDQSTGPDPAASPSGPSTAPWVPEVDTTPEVRCTMVPDMRQFDWWEQFLAAGGDPRCVDLPASAGSVDRGV